MSYRPSEGCRGTVKGGQGSLLHFSMVLDFFLTGTGNFDCSLLGVVIRLSFMDLYIYNMHMYIYI